MWQHFADQLAHCNSGGNVFFLLSFCVLVLTPHTRPVLESYFCDWYVSTTTW